MIIEEKSPTKPKYMEGHVILKFEDSLALSKIKRNKTMGTDVVLTDVDIL